MNRDEEIVRLIKRVKASPAKITAIKVEMEGVLGRKDRCGKNCKRKEIVEQQEPGSISDDYFLGPRPMRVEVKSHAGCKNFTDTKIANDFILRELAKIGLAERGSTQWSYCYKPKLPLVFSRVYTDSETEWTVTLSLKNPENVLLLPKLVDAFNKLAKVNGTKAIGVDGSGMHTSFLQDKNGLYPSNHSEKPEQRQRFENFQKSMTPLLPALYLLGSNRLDKNGKGITRSTDCRQPKVSREDKYSAIAYRGGALEFRVFDTCYDNRDMILDYVAVMARAVSKYWRKEYRTPYMDKFFKDSKVYFGSDKLGRNRINSLDDVFVIKEHLLILNEGLKRIKPPYQSIGEVKRIRGFNKSVRQCVDLKSSSNEFYQRYVAKQQLKQDINYHQTVTYLYQDINNSGNRPETEKSMKYRLAKARKFAREEAKRAAPIKPAEAISYEDQFGRGYSLGTS